MLNAAAWPAENPMEHFSDQPLPEGGTILVLGTSKLGNLVVLMPLLRALKHKYPTCRLLFRGSFRTIELEQACPWIDERFDQEAPLPLNVDLLINADAHNPATADLAAALRPRFVVGPARALAPGPHPRQRLALDQGWADPDLQDRYPDLGAHTSIRALHCLVSWLSADAAEDVELPWQPPAILIPPVLLSINAEREAKLWPVKYWIVLLSLLEDFLGLRRDQFGLIGALPPPEGVASETELVKSGVGDLRGKLSLPELVGAYRHCHLAIGVDSGPLHLAAASGCPTVGIFGADADGMGASPRRLWAPRQPWVRITTSQVSCDGCFQSKYHNDKCVMPIQKCLEAVQPADVLELVRELLAVPILSMR